MSRIAGFFRRVGLLLRRERFRTDLSEEMAFHREQSAQDLEAKGMSAQEARQAAARQFGNAEALKDRSTEAVGFRVEAVMQDLSFALRQLRRNPGFAVTVIVITALGTGAGVAIFGFVDAALIKPLPYREPARLAMLFESNTLGPRFHLSYPDYLDWKDMNRSFASLDVFGANGFLLKTPEGTQRADGASVSAGFFHTLGVTPVLGRDFYPNEDIRGGAHTVLLSYGAWQKRFGGRQDALGQTVNLDGTTNTIIGVLPQSFHFAPAEPAEFWRLLQPGRREQNRGAHGLFSVARLKDGTNFSAASADLTAIAAQLERQYPDSNRDRGGRMLPLPEAIDGDVRPILLSLLAGAALLMLIASANVVSLLLVRSESRRREIAVRGALGASAGRLLRQFITEGLLLAAAGSVLGVIGGMEATHLLIKLIPRDILVRMPYLQELGMSSDLAVFTASICGMTALLYALAPTFRLFGTELREELTIGGQASSRFWRRFSAKIVVIEIATAMVLLVGAGLLSKSLYRLLHQDAGLVPDHLALLRGVVTGSRYADDSLIIALGRQINARLASFPGVKSVGIANTLPLGAGDGVSDFRVIGRPYHGQHDEVANRSVNPGYFRTVQARILRGRNFLEDEDRRSPRVAIVNQTLANKYFHDEDPIGKRVAWVYDLKTEMEIVGVVGDIQEGQLDSAPQSTLYVNYDQDTSGDFAVVVRTSRDEQSLLPLMATTIHQLDPGVAVFDPETMYERIHDSPSAYLHRISAWVVGSFAVIALLLSVVGLYGAIAYSVAQRTREIGVRMALGAQRGSVYRLILKEAGCVAGLGIALGMACSLGAAMLIRKLLFGTEAWDAGTLSCVAVILVAATMLASYIPARRAAGVNPVEALRAE